ISRPDKIGDMVLALHGVKQLKKELPHAQVFVQCGRVTEPLVRMVSFVDGTVLADEDLSPYQFDAAVDLMAKNWTSKNIAAARIPIRIGNAARWFRHRFSQTVLVRRSKALMNEAEYNWQFMRLLNPKLKNTPLRESLVAGDFRFKESPILEELGVNQFQYVLMPGVTASALPWKQEYWVELAGTLSRSGTTLILLGPDERSQVEFYKQEFQGNSTVLVKCLENFEQLFSILQRSNSYVGPSTGVTHLASAFGVPGVAIYPEEQSLHPRRWQPFHNTLRVLSLTKGVTPGDVITALKEGSVPQLEPLYRERVSAFVVCCNEERNIRRCLESIRWCDELIVVDSGSTDRTVDICKEYTPHVLHREWEGHSKQKQFALSQCNSDWILNVDSDEEVSMELRNRLEAILSASYRGEAVSSGYAISRIVHFLNIWWDRGGWWPEYRIRFFKRAGARWGGIDPHEKVEVAGEVAKLNESIFHYTYRSLEHQMQTLNAHSSLSALRMYSLGRKSSLGKILFRPVFRFFKFFVLKRGFLYGSTGLVVGIVDAIGTFLKYTKLWELQSRGQAERDEIHEPVFVVE
ncbi:MAG: glycosyltransferase, partial [Bdellovibrionales bacterium]|nr:glycosyltransferase [Bdellovibrionales bacterium]